MDNLARMLDLEEIRVTLTARPHVPAPFSADATHAGVAMILADGTDGLEACFIRRAERYGDPWSGQVAFPGGRAEPGDAHAQAVAERETFEEIGVVLEAHHHVGPLPIRPIDRRGDRQGLTLSPFVYHVEARTRDTAWARMPAEVADVFWVPLTHLFDDSATTELEYPFGGRLTTFPGIQFDDHVIWGLTLRVLESFADIMQRKLPAMA